MDAARRSGLKSNPSYLFTTQMARIPGLSGYLFAGY